MVFLSDDEKLPAELNKVLEKEKIRTAIITVYAAEGSKQWKIAKEAEVTVVFIRQWTAEANFAYRPGELDDRAIAKIVQSAKTLKPK